MKLAGIILASVLSIYITTLGIDQLVVYFHGSSLGFFKTYLLGLAVSVIRNNPFVATRKVLQIDNAELVGMLGGVLILDCVAAFLILPYVLGT